MIEIDGFLSNEDHLFECILVNTVAWAPYEYGLMLACGSSDGSISILSSTGKCHSFPFLK